MELRNKKIVVTGGTGFLGTYVIKRLKAHGATDIFIPRSGEHDLRTKDACQKVVKDAQVIIHLAAQVGGIGYIDKFAGEIFYNNLVMGIELMEAAQKAGVEKFVTIGTVCEYPKNTQVPFREEYIWDGYPEEITAPYGWAKKMLLVQAMAYKKQYGFNAIHLLPVNLYGPGDNFDKESAHVIPALVRKTIEARDNNKPFLEVWGTGRATREFLYVEDAAEVIVLATMHHSGLEPVNLGSGMETSIKDIAGMIVEISGYKGSIKWNSDRPDGQPRRRLDVSKAKEFGFSAKTSLKEGLEKTIRWYEEKFS